VCGHVVLSRGLWSRGVWSRAVVQNPQRLKCDALKPDVDDRSSDHELLDADALDRWLRFLSSYTWPLSSDTVSAAVSVCLSAARLVPYVQRPRCAAKLAALRATSPTGLSVSVYLSFCLSHVWSRAGCWCSGSVIILSVWFSDRVCSLCLSNTFIYPASVAAWKLNCLAGPMAWTSTFVTATCY